MLQCQLQQLALRLPQTKVAREGQPCCLGSVAAAASNFLLEPVPFEPALAAGISLAAGKCARDCPSNFEDMSDSADNVGLVQLEACVDSLALVLKWVALIDLRSIARTSKLFRAASLQHIKTLEQLRVEGVGSGRGSALRAVSGLRWALGHANHTAIRSIDVGSEMPHSWCCPMRLLLYIKEHCVSVQYISLQGMAFIDEHFRGELDFVLGTTFGALPNLKMLDLTYCTQFDAEKSARLQAFLPGVEIKRLPDWYLLGDGQHVCVSHPGAEESWFSIGEIHTYSSGGRFVFEPRERCSSGVVNRCWPLPGGLILELQFDAETPQYRPMVRIEVCSAEYAHRHVTSSGESATRPNTRPDESESEPSIYFTSAHSTTSLAPPATTPALTTADIAVGIWRITAPRDCLASLRAAVPAPVSPRCHVSPTAIEPTGA